MSNAMYFSPRKRMIIIAAIISVLLLIPFIAMQFSPEVNWSAMDFGIAGIIFLGTGLLVELAIRKLRTTNSRLIALMVVFITVILLWLELAVGIFGSPIAGS